MTITYKEKVCHYQLFIDKDNPRRRGYNVICDCTTDHCWKCGWNPSVAKRRIERIRNGN